MADILGSIGAYVVLRCACSSRPGCDLAGCPACRRLRFPIVVGCKYSRRAAWGVTASPIGGL